MVVRVLNLEKVTDSSPALLKVTGSLYFFLFWISAVRSAKRALKKDIPSSIILMAAGSVSSECFMYKSIICCFVPEINRQKSERPDILARRRFCAIYEI